MINTNKEKKCRKYNKMIGYCRVILEGIRMYIKYRRERLYKNRLWMHLGYGKYL